MKDGVALQRDTVLFSLAFVKTIPLFTGAGIGVPAQPVKPQIIH